jgi:hypothetical protein
MVRRGVGRLRDRTVVGHVRRPRVLAERDARGIREGGVAREGERAGGPVRDINLRVAAVERVRAVEVVRAVGVVELQARSSVNRR